MHSPPPPPPNLQPNLTPHPPTYNPRHIPTPPPLSLTLEISQDAVSRIVSRASSVAQVQSLSHHTSTSTVQSTLCNMERIFSNPMTPLRVTQPHPPVVSINSLRSTSSNRASSVLPSIQSLAQLTSESTLQATTVRIESVFVLPVDSSSQPLMDPPIPIPSHSSLAESTTFSFISNALHRVSASQSSSTPSNQTSYTPPLAEAQRFTHSFIADALEKVRKPPGPNHIDVSNSRSSSTITELATQTSITDLAQLTTHSFIANALSRTVTAKTTPQSPTNQHSVPYPSNQTPAISHTSNHAIPTLSSDSDQSDEDIYAEEVKRELIPHTHLSSPTLHPLTRSLITSIANEVVMEVVDEGCERAVTQTSLHLSISIARSVCECPSVVTPIVSKICVSGAMEGLSTDAYIPALSRTIPIPKTSINLKALTQHLNDLLLRSNLVMSEYDPPYIPDTIEPTDMCDLLGHTLDTFNISLDRALVKAVVNTFASYSPTRQLARHLIKPLVHTLTLLGVVRRECSMYESPVLTQLSTLMDDVSVRKECVQIQSIEQTLHSARVIVTSQSPTTHSSTSCDVQAPTTTSQAKTTPPPTQPKELTPTTSASMLDTSSEDDTDEDEEVVNHGAFGDWVHSLLASVSDIGMAIDQNQLVEREHLNKSTVDEWKGGEISVEASESRPSDLGGGEARQQAITPTAELVKDLQSCPSSQLDALRKSMAELMSLKSELSTLAATVGQHTGELRNVSEKCGLKSGDGVTFDDVVNAWKGLRRRQDVERDAWKKQQINHINAYKARLDCYRNIQVMSAMSAQQHSLHKSLSSQPPVHHSPLISMRALNAAVHLPSVNEKLTPTADELKDDIFVAEHMAMRELMCMRDRLARNIDDFDTVRESTIQRTRWIPTRPDDSVDQTGKKPHHVNEMNVDEEVSELEVWLKARMEYVGNWVSNVGGAVSVEKKAGVVDDSRLVETSLSHHIVTLNQSVSQRHTQLLQGMQGRLRDSFIDHTQSLQSSVTQSVTQSMNRFQAQLAQKRVQHQASHQPSPTPPLLTSTPNPQPTQQALSGVEFSETDIYHSPSTPEAAVMNESPMHRPRTLSSPSMVLGVSPTKSAPLPANIPEGVYRKTRLTPNMRGGKRAASRRGGKT